MLGTAMQELCDKSNKSRTSVQDTFETGCSLHKITANHQNGTKALPQAATPGLFHPLARPYGHLNLPHIFSL